MTNPVPGFSVSTPYGRRGSYWSCDEDANGNGIHTGADYASPQGTKCVAARPGKVVHSSHGSAFGSHQIDILPGDGTRDFYAHMRSRVPDGTRVEAGDKVGEVGSEGNVTGPHLHFERHATEWGGWSCSVVRDPAPSINYAAKPDPPKEDPDMPKFSRTKMTKPLKLKAGEWTTLVWDHVSSGSAGKDGEAYILIGPSPFTATLSAAVDEGATGDVVRTRFIERSKNKEGAWETVDTYPNVEHPLTAGATFISDTRTQNVAEGDRLICQVNLPNGGTITSAELNALYF